MASLNFGVSLRLRVALGVGEYDADTAPSLVLLATSARNLGYTAGWPVGWNDTDVDTVVGSVRQCECRACGHPGSLDAMPYHCGENVIVLGTCLACGAAEKM